VKSRRLAEISEENHLPAIHLVESAGADLPNQSRIFVPGGRAFRDITRGLEGGHPQHLPGVRQLDGGRGLHPGHERLHRDGGPAGAGVSGGPAAGQDGHQRGRRRGEPRRRGHAQPHSGVSDYLAHDEYEAIRLGREIVSLLPASRKAGPSPSPSADVAPPLYDAEDLLGIVSADVKVPFDAREVIARLVDGSAFHEFKPEFGTTLVTGWAQVHGYPVGILANQGVLFSESAQKGAQFIQLCNQKSVPLLFLQNITGFMVGTQYEQGGIIKHGAKLINAVSNSTVPAITIMMGASFGAGNYGMCGRAYAPRFLFSWPNHRIAVMGGEQLAGVLEIVKRDAAAKSGQSVDEMELSMMKMMLSQQIDKESNAYFATARLWDDGIIDPRDTRDVVGLCLSATHNAPVEGTMAFGVFRH
jgi:acetyl-CoA carboxylase carboxyltransferase component